MALRLRGETALVVFELEGESMVIIGLDRGEVVMDALASIINFDDLRADFSQKIRNKEFEVWGEGDHVPGDHRKLQIEEVLPKRGGPEFAPLRAVQPAFILGSVGGTALVVAAAWFAYSQVKLADQQRLARELLDRNSPAAQYERSVEQLLAKPVVPLGEAVQVVREAVASQPLFHAGWELHGVTCAPSGVCSLRYRRIVGTGTTYLDFSAAREPGWQSTAPAGEDESVVTIAVAIPSAKLQRASWPTTDEFLQRNRAQWQFLEPGGWKATLGSRSLQGVPAGIEAKNIPALSSSPSAVFAIPVTIGAQQWWYADNDPDSPMLPELLGSNTVMDGDLELTVSKKEITFSVKGLSYVR